ncbi:hypothetical protein AAKU55_001560 [Oxalobacteraceae bacterium GrIS 1.11]
MLVIDGTPPVAARTLDVGSGGVSATVAESLRVGMKGRISFEMYIDGKSHLIDVRIAVSHCVLGNDGFKVGFQFANLDLAGVNAIAKYMR